MLPISLCFWSPWFCSLKQTPSVPVSGLLPLLRDTEGFIPALCTTEFHPLLLCWAPGSPRPSYVMFLCCADGNFPLCQHHAYLWLSTPGACSASHHQVRTPLSSHANVTPMSSSRILWVFLFHKLSRFGSLSFTLPKSFHSSSFVLWLCRTVFHLEDTSSILSSRTRIILCLAEWKHAQLDGGHLAVQIGSQGK